jgi:hypothetical protein
MVPTGAKPGEALYLFPGIGAVCNILHLAASGAASSRVRRHLAVRRMTALGAIACAGIPSVRTRSGPHFRVLK